MKKFKFSKPLTNNSNKFISLDFEVISENKNITDLTSTYIISKIWRGKFFIKRLINKVFKHKINKKMNWNKKFWEEIKILNTKFSYKLPDQVSTLEQLKDILVNETNSKRMKDIMKYQKLLKENINMNLPLFITGNALNTLGANVNSDDIYFLDGSRRLIANILNDNINNKALIIELK